MLNNRKFLIFILTIIFAVGLFFRFYKLAQYPVGFHVDEASRGCNAYSLLHTGRDDNNNRFPLYIDIFGDNSPAGYHYLTIIPVAIFGLTEFAVRFPGALFGALSVMAMFFLSYSMFGNKEISVLSTLLLAIAPWHINLSRASSDGIIALFFVMVGFTLTLWSLKNQTVKHLITGTIFLSTSFFFYHTPRVFVPLLFLALIVLFFLIWKIKVRNYYKKAFILALAFMLILDFVLIFVVSGGTGRFSQVNIFNYPETRLVLEEQIREDGISGVSTFITRFFHNKAINYSLSYISNYAEYFSWNFLFIKGLPDWYSVPNMGVMYLVEMPFVLLGIGLLAFHKNRLYKIPLIWLILAPTTVALTADLSNIHRALVMYPMLEIIAAYGLIHFFTKIVKQKRLIIASFITLLFILNISYFLHQYFVQAKVHRPWYRNNGFSQMMELVNKNYGNYDRIITTRSGGGYPLFLFYSKYDPLKYQAEGSPKDKNYKGFGKFIFVPDICPFISKNPLIPKKGKIIFIEDGTCKENANLHKVPFTYVLREDGTKAFRIVYVQDDQIFKAK